MMVDDTIFVDTNILLAATDISRNAHLASANFLRSPNTKLTFNGQVLRKYMVVTTRPLSANGFGMNPFDAYHNVSRFRSRIRLLEENIIVSQLLQELVKQYDLRGKRIHDANIAATMFVWGLHKIVTLNPTDFHIFEQITVLSP